MLPRLILFQSMRLPGSDLRYAFTSSSSRSTLIARASNLTFLPLRKRKSTVAPCPAGCDVVASNVAPVADDLIEPLLLPVVLARRRTWRSICFQYSAACGYCRRFSKTSASCCSGLLGHGPSAARRRSADRS